MAAEVTDWIGLAFTATTIIGGGWAYIQHQSSALRKEAEDRVQALKIELETRFNKDIERVEKTVDEERIERRREHDRIERTLEGFADVATAVVAMGKSIEHLAERITSSQNSNDRVVTEIKDMVRNLETRVVDAQMAKASSPGRRRKAGE